MKVEGSRFLLLQQQKRMDYLLNMNASDGLIQVITDNFDTANNSQNGMKQTHALASIFAEANCSDEDNDFKFPPLKQEEIKSTALRDISLSVYSGKKKLKWIHILVQVVYLH